MKNWIKYIFACAITTAAGFALVIGPLSDMPADFRDAVISGPDENSKSGELDTAIPVFDASNAGIPAPKAAGIADGSQETLFINGHTSVEGYALLIYKYHSAGSAQYAKLSYTNKKPTGREKTVGIIVRNPAENPLKTSNFVKLFAFNDLEDASDISRDPRAQYIKFPDDSDVRRCIDAGIKSAPEYLLGRINYAAREGAGKGKMDFAYRCEYEGYYLMDGIFYNDLDFGNYTWGAAMAKLDISYFITAAGSQANAVLNTYTQNTNLESPWHGFCLTGDDPADQRAIKAGYFGRFGKNTVPDTLKNCQHTR